VARASRRRPPRWERERVRVLPYLVSVEARIALDVGTFFDNVKEQLILLLVHVETTDVFFVNVELELALLLAEEDFASITVTPKDVAVTQDRVVFNFARGAILEDVVCLSKVTLENMDWYFDVVFGEAVDSAGDLVQVLGPTCVVLFRIDASLRAELAGAECFEVSNVVRGLQHAVDDSSFLLKHQLGVAVPQYLLRLYFFHFNVVAFMGTEYGSMSLSSAPRPSMGECEGEVVVRRGKSLEILKRQYGVA
jgi:hypothetical protein